MWLNICRAVRLISCKNDAKFSYGKTIISSFYPLCELWLCMLASFGSWKGVIYDLLSLCAMCQRVTDADIRALVSDEVFQPAVVWKLHDLQVCLPSFSSFYHGDSNSNPSSEKIIANVMQVTCGTLGLSTATVKLISADGKEHIACSVGTGPVDSAYKAVDLIVKV